MPPPWRETHLLQANQSPFGQVPAQVWNPQVPPQAVPMQGTQPAAEAPQQPGNFWGDFNETMARDPQNAWRVLNQVQPGTVANKLFVME